MKTKRGTPKISGLVVAALRNLRDAHGSSPKEIMKYIMAEYNASESTVQRQLKTALKRGVEYGILKKTNAGYSLNTDAEVIGPIDLAQMDACGGCPKKPKRRGCKPKKKKRSCKRRKRPSCPRKKRKRNPCNVCATRGRKDCSRPIQMVRENSPANLEDDDMSASNTEADKRNVEDDGQEGSPRSRSNSRRGSSKPRSRSQSEAGFSDEDDDDDKDED
ncbi:histone H1, early embryonic-like [Copidosoma floridanum]|uniref:histone H1, early embryonic-like n=1 Tax=Copidosoma floridanum TaxID=29053 RepID=UPI0006C956B5|nr:histone H1, early embryonic-like [Copidosoma floridanum]